MEYGVVIVTYNRLSLLKECVDNVSNQSKAFSKIIIVNNNSSDGTKEYLDEITDERFIIKHENENLGGSGGFKNGIEIASREQLDWVLIIDDDAIINNDYIEICDEFLSKHKKVLACSGTVKTNDKIQLIHRRIIKNKLLHLETNVGIDAYSKEAFRYDLATFCGLMINMKVLKKIGLPKSEYFIWYDDTEYSLRLKRFGGIVNINKAIINHKTVESVITEGFFKRMSWRSYYGHRNRLDAVKCHCGTFTKVIIYIQFYIFIMCGRFMCLSNKNRKQGKYIVVMLKDALKDAREGNLGKNQKYLPGR